jgi:hypothetical protein
MAEERWMKIEGYPNYSVSDHGQARNDTTEKLLKPGLSSSGYLHICLFNNDKRKMHKVHRLVAIAFCERPNENTEVDHIDHDRGNNQFTNLRWVSSSNNNRNKRKKAGTSSHFKGVYWYERYKKWRAQISLNKKRKSLGYFDSEEEASHAFRTAVAFYHLEEYYPLDEVKRS